MNRLCYTCIKGLLYKWLGVLPDRWMDWLFYTFKPLIDVQTSFSDRSQ